PSTAIVEVLRQRQFADWVAPDSENWLEQIALLVGDLDLSMSSVKLPESIVFKSMADFQIVKGSKQLLIPQKNVNEIREQLKLF
ncbi:MAG: hypothetical protein ACK45T_05090, partial [Pseudanabaena sp.]